MAIKGAATLPPMPKPYSKTISSTSSQGSRDKKKLTPLTFTPSSSPSSSPPNKATKVNSATALTMPKGGRENLSNKNNMAMMNQQQKAKDSMKSSTNNNNKMDSNMNMIYWYWVAKKYFWSKKVWPPNNFYGHPISSKVLQEIFWKTIFKFDLERGR